jgi:hypothetical protein
MSTYLIQSCFQSPQSALLTELILLYVGNDFQLDRFTLQTHYKERHRADPLKSKTLQVVYVRTEQQHEYVRKTLQNWHAIGLKQTSSLIQAAKMSASIDTDLLKNLNFWNAYTNLIYLANSAFYDDDFKTTLISSERRIEGISYSHPNTSMRSARQINCLLSAPWNHIEGRQAVKGVGIALIEHAALQSLKQQKIDPDGPLSPALLQKAAITLEATEFSRAFYTQLFFAQQKNADVEMILSKQNVVRFFERFGGRAVCQRDSIAI